LMNIKTNQASNVRLLQGDVRIVAPELKVEFDRIVMPLPESSLKFLSIALKLLKERGIVHLYQFSPKKADSDLKKKIEQICQDNGRLLISTDSHLCGHKSPAIYRLCLDLQIARRES